MPFDREDIHDRLSSALRETLRAIGTDGDGRPAIETEPTTEWSFGDVREKKYTGNAGERPWAIRTVAPQWEALKPLPAVQQLAEGLLPFTNELPNFYRGNLDLDEQLAPELTAVDRAFTIRILCEGLEHLFNGGPVEAYASEVLDLIENTLVDPGLRWILRTPIENFEVEDREWVDLGDDTRLRRMTRMERKALVQDPNLGVGPSAAEAATMGWTLEVEWIESDDPPRPQETPMEIPERIIDLLRVFRPAQAGYSYYSIRRRHWVARVPDPSGRAVPYNSLPGLQDPYDFHDDVLVLSDEQAETFHNLWQSYKRTRSEGGFPTLDLAISRFSGSTRRLLEENRLVDCIIAIEALLKRDQNVYANRVKTCCTVLLRGNDGLEVDVDRVLDSAYRDRNAIVHGDVSHLEHSGIEAVESVTRSLILEYLDLASGPLDNHAQFLDQIYRYIDKTGDCEGFRAFLDDSAEEGVDGGD